MTPAMKSMTQGAKNMMKTTRSQDNLIAEMLDITPSIVPFCIAIGRFSREWNEKKGSIRAFVGDNALDLPEQERALVARCVVTLQPPVIGAPTESSAGPDDGHAENRTTN